MDASYKKTDVFGVKLDMNSGKLYFRLNWGDFKLAYTSEELKQGPIYPLICFYIASDCKIIDYSYTPSKKLATGNEYN